MFAAKEATKREDGAALARGRLPAVDGMSRNHTPLHAPDSVRLQQRYLGNSHLQSRPETAVQRKECDGSCGGTCPSCRRRKRLAEQMQTKLEVGPADDMYEREADHVAAQVMRMSASEASEGLASPSTLSIRRLPAGGGGQQVPPDFQISQSGGRPLLATTRQFMEPHFGVDFGHVRLHTDQEAQQTASQIQASAFTYGNHIWLGKGASEDDKGLMAHELTHVVQQASRPGLVNKKMLQRQMRRATAADTAPACTDVDYVVPPAAEHERVDAAIAIIDRVVSNPTDYPNCPTHFEDHCPGGTDTSLQDQYDRAIVWKIENYPDEWLGGTCGTSPNIGYTDISYRPSHWAIAAALVHEMMHMCGVAGHPASTLPGYTDILDEAKHWCGRLPNL